MFDDVFIISELDHISPDSPSESMHALEGDRNPALTRRPDNHRSRADTRIASRPLRPRFPSVMVEEDVQYVPDSWG